MEPPFTRTALLVMAGLLIWACDFLFVYIFAAAACARGYADFSILGFGVVPMASAISSVLAIAGAVCAWAAARQSVVAARSEEGIFRSRIAFIASMLALIAIVMTALPGLLVRNGCS